MLTYAFDLLVKIYEEEGYAPSEIPGLILRHNLHGLEICPRAAQLAELALVFKAREKSRRFFQPEHLVRPRIIELCDLRFDEGELSAYFTALDAQPSTFNPQLLQLLHQFEEAKNFGSLIQPCVDERAIADVRCAVEAKDIRGQLFLRETHIKVLRVLEQAEALTQRYHVVVANPPYMGAKGMNGAIKQFLQDNFADYKSDLFAAFIIRSLSLTLPDGYSGFMSPFVWMFISSYEGLRNRLISEATIMTLVQLEYSGFDGATVPICTFALQNKPSSEYQGGYVRLTDFRGSDNQGPRTLEAVANPSCGWFFRASAYDFKQIPGMPIAYWISKQLRKMFESHHRLGDFFFSDGVTKTGDNERYLRKWWELPLSANIDPKQWRICVKGGEARSWAGNTDNRVDWHPETRAHYHKDHVARITPEYLWEAMGISWTKISSRGPTFRMFGNGMIAETGGPAIFSDPKKGYDPHAALSFLCSNTSFRLLTAINPTLNFQTNDVLRLPIPEPVNNRSVEIGKENIKLSLSDWDNCETSWDFRDNPLWRSGKSAVESGRQESEVAQSIAPSYPLPTTLEASYKHWEAESSATVLRMQELETENNRLFIAAYGLEGELQPEVPLEQITLRCNPVFRYGLGGQWAVASGQEKAAELQRRFREDTVKEFLSYAVGCMMGRYCPDHPGLILANAGDNLREFLEKVGKPLAELTYAPDEDGIIPVLDAEWFEDDIVARTRDFLRATFGEATLRENLRFIEDSLGKDLRKYFLNDFYKDHLQTYKKRPIYWLVQSPKKSFSALFYLHRYTRDTMNLVLNSYLRDYEVKLRNRLAHVSELQVIAATAKARTEARKETDKFTKILAECEEWERQVLLPLAQARIELDLDDGVKTNYQKLGEALATIPGLAAKEEE